MPLSKKDRVISVISSRHCAMLDDDLMWHTDSCFKQHPFYCSSGDTLEYRQTRLNWDNASANCESSNMTLITVTKNNTASLKSPGWIGLEVAADGRMRWSGGMTSNYRNWAAKEPVAENCVVYKEIRQSFSAKDCTKTQAAVCQDDNLVVVKENKTWEQALNHCRKLGSRCDRSKTDCTHKYNLLSLQDSDFQYVRGRISRATTDEVRICVKGRRPYGSM